MIHRVMAHGRMIHVVMFVLSRRVLPGLDVLLDAMSRMNGVIVLRGRSGWCLVRRMVMSSGNLVMFRMCRMILRGCREGDQHRGSEKQAAHHASPSGNGRTVTTCIIPACMW